MTEKGFRRAVRSNVPRDARTEAVDRTTESGEDRNLAVIVKGSGFPAYLRRRALEGLGEIGADEVLEELSEDGSIAETLRDRADELSG